MKDPIDNMIFLPAWFEKAILCKSSKNFRDFSSNCVFWDFPKIKHLGIVLNLLQQAILAKKLKNNTFQINLKTLPKELGYKSEEDKLYQVLSFLSDLGSLKLYRHESNKRTVLPLLVEKDRDENHITLELPQKTDELILGIASAFQTENANKQDSSDQRFLSKTPIGIKKSLWLDLKQDELSDFILMERSSSSDASLAALPSSFSFEASALQLFKKFSPLKGAHKLNALAKKASFHGLTKPAPTETPLWIDSRHQNIKGVFTRKISIAAEELTLYQRNLNLYYSQKILGHFPSFLETLFTKTKIRRNDYLETLFKQSVLSYLSDYSHDFILDKEGRLCPLVFLFLEFYIRIQQSGNTIKKDFSFLISELNPQNIMSIYLRFVSSLSLEPKLENYLIENSVLLNPFVQNKTLATQSTTEKSVTQENKPNIPHPSSQNTIPKEKHWPSPASENSEHKQIKSMIEKDLTQIKTGSRKDYQRIKELYYNSLNEKSLTVIMTLEKKMRQELFEHQIKQRLVNFIYKNPDNQEIKSMVPLEKRSKSQNPYFEA